MCITTYILAGHVNICIERSPFAAICGSLMRFREWEGADGSKRKEEEEGEICMH